MQRRLVINDYQHTNGSCQDVVGRSNLILGKLHQVFGEFRFERKEFMQRSKQRDEVLAEHLLKRGCVDQTAKASWGQEKGTEGGFTGQRAREESSRLRQTGVPINVWGEGVQEVCGFY